MKKIFAFFLWMSLFPAAAAAQEIGAPYLKIKNSFFENPNPQAPEWSGVAQQAVMLLPQNITPPSIFATTVPQLKVKALHNKKWLAIRLEWEDTTKNIHVETDQDSDACAVQFPLGEAEKTSPFMGNKGAPVAILHWKSIWQQDIEKGYQQVKDLYPNTWVDTERFGIHAATDVKNPVSWPGRKIPAEELMAEGFGTLTTQPEQNARGAGVWENGKWAVVLARPFKTGDPLDPVLKIGKTTSLAFAVWEGKKENVGARKNYAPWIPIVLEPTLAGGKP